MFDFLKLVIAMTDGKKASKFKIVVIKTNSSVNKKDRAKLELFRDNPSNYTPSSDDKGL